MDPQVFLRLALGAVPQIYKQETPMTQKQQPNRAQRRAMAFGHPALDGVQPRLTPMGKAVQMRHKKPFQKKQENKALEAHGLKPKHMDV